MPSYNAEKHVMEAIQSVRSQTMTEWELLVSDDCSTDETRAVVEKAAKEDSRIHLFTLKKNSGAAAARNNSLINARGRYIAYLDADDIWFPEKLEHQIAFMEERNAAFSCCAYEVIDEDGNPMGRTVRMLDECNYWGFLTHNLLQTVGIMIDSERIDRNLLIMPLLRRRQDAATWLQILRAGYICYGVPEVLCAYRRVSGSLSSNKAKAAKGVWFLYREVECLPLHASLYCFVRYAILAIWKRTYTEYRGTVKGKLRS